MCFLHRTWVKAESQKSGMAFRNQVIGDPPGRGFQTDRGFEEPRNQAQRMSLSFT